MVVPERATVRSRSSGSYVEDHSRSGVLRAMVGSENQLLLGDVSHATQRTAGPSMNESLVLESKGDVAYDGINKVCRVATSDHRRPLIKSALVMRSPLWVPTPIAGFRRFVAWSKIRCATPRRPLPDFVSSPITRASCLGGSFAVRTTHAGEADRWVVRLTLKDLDHEGPARKCPL